MRVASVLRVVFAGPAPVLVVLTGSSARTPVRSVSAPLASFEVTTTVNRAPWATGDGAVVNAGSVMARYGIFALTAVLLALSAAVAVAYR